MYIIDLNHYHNVTLTNDKKFYKRKPKKKLNLEKENKTMDKKPYKATRIRNKKDEEEKKNKPIPNYR